MKIEKLNSSHKRENFCCGIESLNHYIQKQATQDARRHLSVTYVLNDEDKIVAGFYTLSSTTIESNFLAEETHYHEDETEFTEKYIFKKNGSGKLNSIEKHYQDGSIEITNFEYNEAGNLIKKIQFDEDGNTEKTNEYIFDSSNQLIESKEMDESGSIHENILLKYDSKNRLIEAEELDIANQTGIITFNSYNEKDEISESIIRDAKGKLLRKITNMHDESGNIMKRNLENYNEYHRIDITNYSYDHESRIVSEEVLGPFEEIRQKTNYEYNADGNLEITYHYETENTQNPGSHYWKTRMQYEFYD